SNAAQRFNFEQGEMGRTGQRFGEFPVGDGLVLGHPQVELESKVDREPRSQAANEFLVPAAQPSQLHRREKYRLAKIVRLDAVVRLALLCIALVARGGALFLTGGLRGQPLGFGRDIPGALWLVGSRHTRASYWMANSVK